MTEYTTASKNGHDAEQSTDIDDRTRRALAERLTVLTPDGTPVENPTRTRFSVTSASGATYQVDLATESCDCADAEYRDPAGGCKHIRRCRLATGRETVPATATADDQLGEHVATPATDGGVVPAAETDHAEVVDDGDDTDPWNGPFTEYDRYGQPTGARYVRCRDCGVEVIVGGAGPGVHADDCPHSR